jgi:hypothetical protein
MRKVLPATIALLLAGTAMAQNEPAPKLDQAMGVVKNISDGEITLADKGGKTQSVKLLPDWTVGVSKTISIEAIKPGSYLGTTNYAKPDGTGTATEVHVSPPGQIGPGLDFVMDAAAKTTMTNGTVSTVVKNEGGRVLDVNYGKGSRRVTVPPGTPVVLNTRGSRDMVKPGMKVRLVTFTPVGGGAPRQFISIGDIDRPGE